MKRNIFLLISIFGFISGSLFSQTQKGSFMASGSTEMSYSSLKTTVKYDGETLGESDDNMNSFNFQPSFGYFVADNLAITGYISYSSESEGDVSANSFMVGPGICYYVGSSNVRPVFLAELGIGSQKMNDGVDEEKFGTFGVSFAGGAAFFISEAISFDAMLGYASVTSTYKDDNKAKVITSGIAFQAGFSVYF